MGDENKPRIKSNQVKFLVSGGLFIIAVVILIISTTQSSADFFMTVEELQSSENDIQNQNLRVSGAVIGESISFDAADGMLRFVIAHIPADKDLTDEEGDLSKVLHQAVADPDNPRLSVIYKGPKPDMLRDEAQAILTGHLNDDGDFVAEELLLKCPSKYEEALPEQVN